MSFLGNLLGLGGAGDSLSQSMGLGGTQNNTSGIFGLGNATEGGGGLLGLNLFGVDNSMRLPLALSMMGGGSNSQAFTNAANLMSTMGPKIEEKRAAQAQQNKTLEFLQKNNPEIAAMVKAGMPINEAWAQVLKSRTPGGGTEYGLNPQYGVDAEGNPVLIQLGKDATGVQTKLPDGVRLSKEPIKLDAGTHFVLLDPITRQPIGQIPKDNYGAAYQTGSGTADAKSDAETRSEYASIASKMPGLRKVVDQLGELGKKATYTLAGRTLDEGMKQMGMEPREAAVARAEYIAMVDNQVLPLLRDTFGAQFTQKEGETLRETLGDPNKSPAEKDAVLKAFIAQKERDVAALAGRTGQGGATDLKSKYGLE